VAKMAKPGNKVCLYNILLRLFSILIDDMQPNATALCVCAVNSWQCIRLIFVLDTRNEEQVIPRFSSIKNLHVQQEENMNFVGI